MTVDLFSLGNANFLPNNLSRSTVICRSLSNSGRERELEYVVLNRGGESIPVEGDSEFVTPLPLEPIAFEEAIREEEVANDDDDRGSLE